MRKRFGWFFLAIATLAMVGCGSQPISQPPAMQKPITEAPKHKIVGPIPIETPIPTTAHNIKEIMSTAKPPFHVVRSFQNIPILMYHSIAVNPKNTLMVAPATFAAEMEHLKMAGYHTITFADLNQYLAGSAELPPKPVLVTFDDGYENNYTEAFPILKQLDLKATVFVISGFVGGKNTLSWDQIREMSDSGVFEIGAHTEHHLDLTTIPHASLTAEIAGSKQAIEEQIGQPVIAFAYPSGRYNDQVVKATEEAGFEFAVTTHPGTASTTQGLLTLRRVRVAGDESAATFATIFP